MSGLAGMIIIEDPTTGPAAMPDHLAAISCPDNCQNEVPLVFQPTLWYADGFGIGWGFAQIQEQIGDNILFRQVKCYRFVGFHLFQICFCLQQTILKTE